jgi:hypothetical protein
VIYKLRGVLFAYLLTVSVHVMRYNWSKNDAFDKVLWWRGGVKHDDGGCMNSVFIFLFDDIWRTARARHLKFGKDVDPNHTNSI